MRALYGAKRLGVPPTDDAAQACHHHTNLIVAQPYGLALSVLCVSCEQGTFASPTRCCICVANGIANLRHKSGI